MVSPAQAQRPEVGGLSYRQQGKSIVVTYELAGEEGETYEVNLLLSGDGGQTYNYEPQAVTGDVGEDIEPGPNKTIIWSVLEDKPGGLQGSAFRFKVTIDEEGGGGWLYVIGGAVLAGSGTALATFLLGGGDGGGGGEGDSSGEFPNPPSPPN